MLGFFFLIFNQMEKYQSLYYLVVYNIQKKNFFFLSCVTSPPLILDERRAQLIMDWFFH